MNHRPKILADKNIPFLTGRLEKSADVEYISPAEFTPEKVKDADALLIRTRTLCDRSLLGDSHVKLVATATIGTDHIDLPFCQGKGITICNAPGCNAPGVAQYVWGSLLHLGFTPGKDRLGLIGCGNVGSIVAQWGALLGTEVWVCDPPKERETGHAAHAALQMIPPDLHHLVRSATKEEIIRHCRAVTLHIPLTYSGSEATFHLIGEKELEMMAEGAILVNAARGPVVDGGALREILEKEAIKAVIDTWEGEPSLDPTLLNLVTVATPHIAGYSRQGKERATRMALEAIASNLGIAADTSGLEGDYQTPQKLTPALIMESYNPEADDRRLRENPDEFELQRQEYNYREEAGL